MSMASYEPGSGYNLPPGLYEDMVRRAYRVGLTENATEVARETARVIAEGIMGVLDDE